MNAMSGSRRLLSRLMKRPTVDPSAVNSLSVRHRHDTSRLCTPNTWAVQLGWSFCNDAGADAGQALVHVAARGQYMWWWQPGLTPRGRPLQTGFPPAVGTQHLTLGRAQPACLW